MKTKFTTACRSLWLGLLLLLAGVVGAAEILPPAPGLRFVQISDSHLVLEADKNQVKDFSHRLLSRSAEVLAGTAAFIGQELKPEFILVTGDGVENGARPTGLESMQILKKQLEQTGAKVFFTFGNHDYFEAKFEQAYGLSNGQFQVGNLTVVLLRAGGFYPRLDRNLTHIPKHVVYQLDDLLALTTDNVIVALHEPLVCQPIAEAWARPDNFAIVNQVLAREQKVPLVLQGHTHEFLHRSENGIAYVICPGLVESAEPATGLAHNFLLFEVQDRQIRGTLYGARSTDDAAAGRFIRSEQNFTVPLAKPFKRSKPGGDEFRLQPLPNPVTRFDPEIERGMKGIALILDRGWKFQLDSDNAGVAQGWQQAGFDDKTWPAHGGFRFYWEHKDKPAGYAWYRLRFILPPELKGEKLELLFNRIFDCDETYLNGRLIGRTGELPPKDGITKSWEGRPRVYPLPLEALAPDGANVLAVRVYDQVDKGGIRDVPCIRFPVAP